MARETPWRENRTLVATGSVLLFLIAWEVAPRIGLVDPRLVSEPSRIVRAGAAVLEEGGLAGHAAVSLFELGIGMALAVAIGVPAGLLLGASRRLREFLDAPIMALNAAPRLALLPVLVVWLGIGTASKAAVVFVGAVLPILVNAAAGVRLVDASVVVATRSLGGKKRDLLLKVLLPGALPAVLSGVRLGLGRGILGVVVGEMYVSQKGIGHQILSMGAGFRVDELLFYTLLVSVFGVSATSALRRLEERRRPGGLGE
jgi:NitT/TauT family transport system permease protein